MCKYDFMYWFDYIIDECKFIDSLKIDEVYNLQR